MSLNCTYADDANMKYAHLKTLGFVRSAAYLRVFPSKIPIPGHRCMDAQRPAPSCNYVVRTTTNLGSFSARLLTTSSSPHRAPLGYTGRGCGPLSWADSRCWDGCNQIISVSKIWRMRREEKFKQSSKP